MTTGSKIKRIREQKGLTQENMADQLGMSQSNYNKIESDKKKALSWDTIQQIAQALDVDVTEFQEEDCKINITNHQHSDYSSGGGIVINHTDEKVYELLEKRIEDKEKVIADKEKVITTLEQQIALLTHYNTQLQAEIASLKERK